MKHTYNGTYCSNCGFSEEEYKASLHQLRTGTILAGKYILGKAIGEGGFGITYIGLDINLNMRVAIKEFFPAGCVTRNATVSDTITVFSGKELEYFNHGRDKFMEEAQIIAQFDSSDGIVSVKDFFLENGTAYIIMELLEGNTLEKRVEMNGLLKAEAITEAVCREIAERAKAVRCAVVTWKLKKWAKIRAKR